MVVGRGQLAARDLEFPTGALGLDAVVLARGVVELPLVDAAEDEAHGPPGERERGADDGQGGEGDGGDHGAGCFRSSSGFGDSTSATAVLTADTTRARLGAVPVAATSTSVDSAPTTAAV